MRNFSIINLRKNIDIYNNIICHISKDDKLFIFTIFDDYILQDEHENIEIITIPIEYRDSESKIKNYVTKYFFKNNFDGFLHVIEDSVEVFNDPSTFVNEIEIMMTKLNMKTWFNTITDKYNYVFNIYNPRFSITIDENEYKQKYDKTINWTSHANTSWICYNFKNSQYSEFEFDERFKIPMFFIIKFLAERRNNKKLNEMYYMNFYPSIDDEKNVFRLLNVNDYKTFKQEEHNEEHILFNSLNINFKQDSVIEPIFEDLIVNLSI